jgi:peptide/nickel transport system permease protein
MISPSEAAPLARVPASARLHRVLEFMWNNKGLSLGLLMLLAILFCTVFAPYLTPFRPNDQDILVRLKPGFWSENAAAGHPLGTDGLGRDMWSRLLFSLRTSLPIAFAAVLIVIVVGVTVALISGTVGGWVDTVLMRLTDIQMAFPFIVLALAVLSLRTPTPTLLVVVLSLSTWPFYARVIRSIIITESQADYVTAARAMGASTWRIIFQYIARNVIPPVFIVATIDIATMIVMEGLLSFLGIGVQPPTPSFGNIIADGKDYITQSWWVSTLPGLAIALIVFSINLVADSLHKFIDPTLRTRY